MLYQSPSGGTKNFSGVSYPYGRFGYSVGYEWEHFVLGSPSLGTVPDYGYVGTGSTQIRLPSVVVRRGSSQAVTCGDGWATYFNGTDFQDVSEGQYCTLRPYFFDFAYFADGFTCVSDLYNAHSSRRALFRDRVNGTNNGLYYVPIFATKKGLALPSSFDGLNVPVLGGTDNGCNTYDILFRIKQASVSDDSDDVPYVVGTVFVVDSSGSGSLFNDSVTKFYGQTDGLVSVTGNGIVRSDWPGIASYEDFVLDTIYNGMPFSGSTIAALKRVSVVWQEVRKWDTSKVTKGMGTKRAHQHLTQVPCLSDRRLVRLFPCLVLRLRISVSVPRLC